MTTLYIVPRPTKHTLVYFQAMASKQFNTISCISTPIHPTSRLPMPSYERLRKSEDPESNNLDLGYRSESHQDDEDEEDAGTNDLLQPNLLSSSAAFEMEDDSLDFYDKLKSLKQQNIHYLQEVEAKLNGRPKPKSSKSVKKPLFVLDVPCTCASKNREQLFDTTEDSDVEEEIHHIFDGVSEESDDDLNLRPSRAKSKVSLRVQSAPIYIDEPPKPNSSKPFKPTVIRPFSMTKRDEEKAKERALMKKLLEERKNLSEESNDECKKVHFKAKPVPRHVKQQLFEKMVNEHPTRYKVGPLMNLKRATSMPTNLSNDDSDQFKAKPFPKAIFKDYAYEQIRENERYRDVRKALRQKALLSAAKLPPRMQKLQEEQIGIDKKLKQPKKEAEKKIVPILTKPPIVPDFEKSYQNFLRSMQRKKAARATTVIQPFSFDDEIDYYKKSTPKSTIQLPEKSASNLTRKFASTPNLSPSVTEAVLASTANMASQLRTHFNKAKKEVYDKEELLQRRKQLENEMRQLEMRENHPAWQKLRYEVVDRSEMEAKKSQRILEDRERAREYKLELEKMNMRVQNQPTLFERQSVMSAKQQAEKRYKQLLQKEGVSEDEISKLITEIDHDYETSRKSSLITDH